MSRVVSLPAVPPDVRYDGVPWTRAEVQEATQIGGPWAVIDSQALSTPLDTDPTRPAVRSVTTSLASLSTGWYRLVFIDGAGGRGEPSLPIRSSIDSDMPPSPDDVRSSSPLMRAKYPVPPTDPYAEQDLRSVVYQATSLVQAITWRLIDPTLGDLSPDGVSSSPLPDGMDAIAAQAIARMSERITVTTAPGFAEQLATGRRLRGFSAGPYSESYFAPGEFARRGASQGRPPVDQDDALDTALWALMSEDARDYFVWRSTGVAPPTGTATAFDYRRQSIGYAAGSLGGWPAHGGPDGF